MDPRLLQYYNIELRHLRETGESNGYNASFTRADRSRFLQALEEAVQAIKRMA